MMFLAMDTVFEQCSIAILDANGQVLSSHTEQGKREQTQHILPMIDAALSEAKLNLAQIKALVFNRGGGAFSGLRNNTVVVQGIFDIAQSIGATVEYKCIYLLEI